MKPSARNQLEGRIVAATRGLAAAAVLLVAGGVARAQDDACATFKWPVARERQAFAGSGPTVESGGIYPAPGTAVSVALLPHEKVAYSVKPRRPPKSAPAYGAELTTSVPQKGTYQVTLSEDAWVDLAQNGKTLRSSGFSTVKGCPGLRKSVRFALQPGPVTLAISDVSASAIKLDLLPAE